MKKIVKYILLVMIGFQIGCENSEVIEIDIPTEEKIVVSANLIGGENFEGVRIIKSLPISNEYKIENSEIKNAIAYLKINNVKVVPLHYKEKGIYATKDSLLIESDYKYELFATVNGEKIYAQTFIPKIPEIISAIQTNDNIEVKLRQHSNEVYGAIWLVQDGTNYYMSEDFQSINGSLSNKDGDELVISTQSLPEKFLESYYRDKYFCRVYSFDKAYLNYFKTRVNSEPIENSLLRGGGSVIWNVNGENTIGLFIGSAQSDIIKVN